MQSSNFISSAIEFYKKAKTENCEVSNFTTKFKLKFNQSKLLNFILKLLKTNHLHKK
jgi:hypothetical protein